jgi:peptidoglycan/LPS O-acetylase OafA/YrhL
MQGTKRLYYLDWLRIMAIIGVLFFHSAMPFAAESDWHIKNKETSNLFLEFTFFLSRFRMPLLFFISGAVAHLILKSKSTGQFIMLRLQRLLVPVLFGMLTIVPVQVYMERVNQGFHGSFLEFYPTIFTTGAYPHGNLSWHHLWFIVYLFVYDLLLAPAFRFISKSAPGARYINALSTNRRIYILIVPSVVLFTAMVKFFPQTHNLINDWCWFIYWLFFFIAGYLCLAYPALTNSLERNRRFSLTLAVVIFLTINYLRWNDLEPGDRTIDTAGFLKSYGYILLYPMTAWFWVFAIIGYGKRYLNKPHSSLSYLNNAAYPFYILHQTVIVVIAFYVVKTSDTILSKYFFLVITAFLVTVLTYHVFIKPFAWLRFVFGVKEVVPNDMKNDKKPLPLVPVAPSTVNAN